MCILVFGVPVTVAYIRYRTSSASDSIFARSLVQRGENLFRIALQVRPASPKKLRRANGITDSDSPLPIGQRLIIPLAAELDLSRGISHTGGSAGETLASIAAALRYRPLPTLMSLNNSGLGRPDLYVGQELTIESPRVPQAMRRQLKVQPGRRSGPNQSLPRFLPASPNIRHSFFALRRSLR